MAFWPVLWWVLSKLGRIRIILLDRDRHPGHTGSIRIRPIRDRYQYQAHVFFFLFPKNSICCPKYFKSWHFCHWWERKISVNCTGIAANKSKFFPPVWHLSRQSSVRGRNLAKKTLPLFLVFFCCLWHYCAPDPGPYMFFLCARNEHDTKAQECLFLGQIIHVTSVRLRPSSATLQTPTCRTAARSGTATTTSRYSKDIPSNPASSYFYVWCSRARVKRYDISHINYNGYCVKFVQHNFINLATWRLFWSVLILG